MQRTPTPLVYIPPQAATGGMPAVECPWCEDPIWRSSIGVRTAPDLAQCGLCGGLVGADEVRQTLDYYARGGS